MQALDLTAATHGYGIPTGLLAGLACMTALTSLKLGAVQGLVCLSWASLSWVAPEPTEPRLLR